MPRKKDSETLELSFTPSATTTSLSKSLFVAGHQCHKLLWWKVHEPNALELQPNKVLQDRFDQGKQVDTLAHQHFAGVEGSRFQAAYEADGVRIRVDVLLPDGDGWRLIEVKSSNSAKDEHLIDCAVQLYVLEANGVRVTAVEVMHLYRECRHPDLSNLLTRTDVTEAVRALLPAIPDQIKAQSAMLTGELPEAPIGRHCEEPYDCPFTKRCWPQDADHIINLHNVGVVRAAKYMSEGVHTVWDIQGKKKKLTDIETRQLRAMKENRLIVEPGLRDALKPFDCKLAFLDFETIQRAVPVWPGMAPWGQEAAQFSCHVANDNGAYDHFEFLAEGPTDCRPALAEAMIAATRDAERVVTYTPFEKTRIKSLQQSVPHLRDELVMLENKLIDLFPVIKAHVYHPDFHGSFSLKYILTPLVPELTYNDLVIVDGMVASVEIARLLFVSGAISTQEMARVRYELLRYCDRDTCAMVRLLRRLREIS
jgi:predicted RecB family nuclease